ASRRHVALHESQQRARRTGSPSRRSHSRPQPLLYQPEHHRMTIRIEVTNPAEHQPSELRAVATFLNNLAADRETGRIAQVGDVAVATHSAPLAVAAVPGASSVTETKQAAADAQEDSPT